MTDHGAVPPSPLVAIEVDDQDRLTINGHEVPHGDVDPRLVATDVVRADFAQPLGRPVRALATLPTGQVRMVIHPDGRVTHVEEHRPASPSGVPPAMRAQSWLAAREADRIVAAEIYAARHAGRRRRYPVVLAGAAALALGATLVVLLTQRGPVADEPAAASPPASAPEIQAAPPQSVIESPEIRPIAVSGVSVETDPREIRLEIAAQRRTTVMVVLTPLDGSASPQGQTLMIHRAADRVVTVSDLDPGRYRWQVTVPGQPSKTGVVQVPDVPPVEEPVVVVPVVSTPEQTDTGGSGAQPVRHAPADPPRPTGVSDGPNHPVDPDGD